MEGAPSLICRATISAMEQPIIQFDEVQFKSISAGEGFHPEELLVKDGHPRGSLALYPDRLVFTSTGGLNNFEIPVSSITGMTKKFGALYTVNLVIEVANKITIFGFADSDQTKANFRNSRGFITRHLLGGKTYYKWWGPGRDLWKHSRIDVWADELQKLGVPEKNYFKIMFSQGR